MNEPKFAKTVASVGFIIGMACVTPDTLRGIIAYAALVIAWLYTLDLIAGE